MQWILLLCLVPFAFSAKWKQCCNLDCSKPVSLSRARTMRYDNSPGHLKFAKHAVMKIIAKNVGGREDLWEAEMYGRKGLVYSSDVSEYQHLCEQLTWVPLNAEYVSIVGDYVPNSSAEFPSSFPSESYIVHPEKEGLDEDSYSGRKEEAASSDQLDQGDDLTIKDHEVTGEAASSEQTPDLVGTDESGGLPEPLPHEPHDDNFIFASELPSFADTLQPIWPASDPDTREESVLQSVSSSDSVPFPEESPTEPPFEKEMTDHLSPVEDVQKWRQEQLEKYNREPSIHLPPIAESLAVPEPVQRWRQEQLEQESEAHTYTQSPGYATVQEKHDITREEEGHEHIGSDATRPGDSFPGGEGLAVTENQKNEFSHDSASHPHTSDSEEVSINNTADLSHGESIHQRREEYHEVPGFDGSAHLPRWEASRQHMEERREVPRSELKFTQNQDQLPLPHFEEGQVTSSGEQLRIDPLASENQPQQYDRAANNGQDSSQHTQNGREQQNVPPPQEESQDPHHFRRPLNSFSYEEEEVECPPDVEESSMDKTSGTVGTAPHSPPPPPGTGRPSLPGYGGPFPPPPGPNQPPPPGDDQPPPPGDGQPPPPEDDQPPPPGDNQPPPPGDNQPPPPGDDQPPPPGDDQPPPPGDDLPPPPGDDLPPPPRDDLPPPPGDDLPPPPGDDEPPPPGDDEPPPPGDDEPPPPRDDEPPPPGDDEPPPPGDDEPPPPGDDLPPPPWDDLPPPPGDDEPLPPGEDEPPPPGDDEPPPPPGDDKPPPPGHDEPSPPGDDHPPPPGDDEPPPPGHDEPLPPGDDELPLLRTKGPTPPPGTKEPTTTDPTTFKDKGTSTTTTTTKGPTPRPGPKGSLLEEEWSVWLMGLVMTLVVILLSKCYLCWSSKKKASKIMGTLRKERDARRQAEKQVQQLSAEKNQLQDEIQRFQTKVQRLQAELYDLRGENQRLQNQLLDLREENQQLQDQLCDCQEQIESEQQRRQDLEVIRRQLEDENNTLNKTAKRLRELLDNCEETVQRLNNDLQQKDALIATLTAEKDACNQQLLHLKAQLGQALQRIKEVQVAKQQCVDNLLLCQQNLQQQLDINAKLTEDNETAHECIQRLQKESEDIREQSNRLQGLLIQKENEVETLQQQVRLLCDDFNEDGEETDESRRERVQSLLDSARAQAEQHVIAGERDSLNCQLQEVTATVSQLQEEKELRENRNQQLTKEVERLRRQLEDCEIKLRTLTDYFEEKELNLHQKLGVEQLTRQQMETQEAQAAERVAQVEQDRVREREELRELRKQMAEIEQRLMKQVVTNERRAEDCLAQLRRTEQELRASNREVTTLRRRLAEVEDAGHRSHSPPALPRPRPHSSVLPHGNPRMAWHHPPPPESFHPPTEPFHPRGRPPRPPRTKFLPPTPPMVPRHRPPPPGPPPPGPSVRPPYSSYSLPHSSSPKNTVDRPPYSSYSLPHSSSPKNAVDEPHASLLNSTFPPTSHLPAQSTNASIAHPPAQSTHASISGPLAHSSPPPSSGPPPHSTHSSITNVEARSTPPPISGPLTHSTHSMIPDTTAHSTHLPTYDTQTHRDPMQSVSQSFVPIDEQVNQQPGADYTNRSRPPPTGMESDIPLRPRPMALPQSHYPPPPASQNYTGSGSVHPHRPSSSSEMEVYRNEAPDRGRPSIPGNPEHPTFPPGRGYPASRYRPERQRPPSGPTYSDLSRGPRYLPPVSATRLASSLPAGPPPERPHLARPPGSFPPMQAFSVSPPRGDTEGPNTM